MEEKDTEQLVSAEQPAPAPQPVSAEQTAEAPQPALAEQPVPAEQTRTDGVRTSVAIDAEMQKRINAPLRKNMLFVMAAGIVLLVVYIVLSVLADEVGIPEDAFFLDVILWVGAMGFGFGIVFLITLGRVNQKQLARGFINHYEFYPEGVVINDERGGEHVSTARLRYTDFEKIKEGKEFFLLYPNKATYFPVDKRLLSQEECEKLRSYFRLPPKKK